MLELEIPEPDTVAIPQFICESDLTLEEIGAIVVFACIEPLSGSKKFLERAESEEWKRSLDRLKSKGILKSKIVDGAFLIFLDLDILQEKSASDVLSPRDRTRCHQGRRRKTNNPI